MGPKQFKLSLSSSWMTRVAAGLLSGTRCQLLKLFVFSDKCCLQERVVELTQKAPSGEHGQTSLARGLRAAADGVRWVSHDSGWQAFA